MSNSDDFDRKVLRILVFSSAYISLIYLVFLLKTPFTWLAVAFFLALAMEPAIQVIQSKSPIKSRGLAAFSVIIISVTVVLFVAATIIPPLVSQTSNLVHSAPSYIEKLQHSNNKAAKYLNKQTELSKINLNSRKVLQQISAHRKTILGTLSGVASVVTSFITVLVLSFFIMLELPQLSKTFWHYQPADKRKHRQQLGAQMHKIIIGAVSGNLLTSLIAAIGAATALAILHIPYAIPLGLLVGIIDLIPLIGASLGAVVVVAVALLYGGPVKAIILAVYFFVYQRIENNTLQPLVYDRTVHISPLLALVAAIFGARLAGLVGALFAIPAAAIGQVLFKDYLENHRQVKTAR